MTAAPSGFVSQTAPRLVNRCAALFVHRGLHAVGAVIGGNIKLGVAFLAIAQASGYGVIPKEEVRPVGIRALSASLNAPYETTRRHVGALIRAGLCERRDSGAAAIASTAFATDAVAVMRNGIWAHYKEMLSELDAVGVEFPRARTITGGEAAHNARHSVQAGIASSLLLRLLEVHLPVFGGDIAAIAVWIALNCESVGLITQNKVLSWKYAALDAPVPDELRRSASVLAVSRMVDMPFETVRRHLARLVETGFCMRISHTGLIVPENYARSNRATKTAQITAIRVFQSLEELARTGDSIIQLLHERDPFVSNACVNRSDGATFVPDDPAPLHAGGRADMRP